jgi:hypothetical protein
MPYYDEEGYPQAEDDDALNERGRRIGQSLMDQASQAGGQGKKKSGTTNLSFGTGGTGSQSGSGLDWGSILGGDM